MLVGAIGPKGQKIAKELGDGLFVTLPLSEFTDEHDWVPLLTWGTVLDDGEAQDSEHARTAAGPGWALAYHGVYEFGGTEAVRQLPGGDAWAEVVNQTEAELRHFAVHAEHGVELNEADQAAWNAGGHEILRAVTISGTRDEMRGKLDDCQKRGVTEIVFQPCGPDIRQELERFFDTATAAS